MVGKARSCIACRQAKMACDARKRTPRPCGRCTDRNLECRFDKHFKRIPTREITSSLTNGLHNMRASQNATEGNSLSPRPPQPAVREPEEYERFLQLDEGEILTDFSIGDIAIPPQIVVELLKHFEQHYYARAPFLQQIHSLASCASESPLLFWTILLIASQHHEDHGHLYGQLFFPHRDLLASLSNFALQSIQEIHALLLLCLWPIPKEKEVLTPTWSYINLVISAAIKLNVHNPLPQDLVSQGWAGGARTPTPISLRTRRLTWLACFSISTQESAFLGFMPPLSSHYHLKNTRKAVDGLHGHLKPDQLASITIYENMCNYSLTLEGVEEPSTSFLLAQSLNGSLDIVKQTYAAEWSRKVDILFQFANLNLSSAALVPYLQQGRAMGPQHITDLLTLLLRGLTAASNLIEGIRADTDCLIPPPAGEMTRGGPRALVVSPKHYFANLFFAAVFLFRVCVLSQPISHAHKALAYQGMADVHETLRLLPQRRDIARAAMMVEKLLGKAHLHETPPPAALNELMITDRLGASIVRDTVLRVRIKGVGDPVMSGGEPQVEEAMRDSLPPAPEMVPAARDATGGAPSFDGMIPQTSEDLIWTDWNLLIPESGYPDMGATFW
ncbi:hypothetical protein F5Y18DRAFT_297246 [Xylariaceae sp. FL1019]|nr:hypothetical protein F5Y18DRAFT_297246 [Xylariaceae sp. FL1019]